MLAAYIIDLLCCIVCSGIVVIGIFLVIAFAILSVGEKRGWW